ncbi:MAG TPA: carbohydrate ABC transporter permease [Candidatus Dormibacteraeota bacterium]|jgi:N,N'-diacetylchitobiose transport system permease protein|nr:carbohydrate ABC transporter permease [Candidatus Dormibacteraeota bacterium]
MNRVPFGRRQISTADVIYNGVGIAVLVVMGFPVYWMVATAFKRGRDILSLVPVWFPIAPSLANFQDAIGRPYFVSSVATSIEVVATTVVASLALAFLASVAVARFLFRGRRLFLFLVIVVQMIPLNALVIPIYLQFNAAGLTDQLPPLVLVYMAYVLPFMVWTLRGFVATVPVDLEEAAMIDGCSRIGAFVRILLPLVAPGLVATSIYAFIQAWNEYITAYILLSSPEHQTLTVWLAGFTTNHGPAWGPLMAGATLTSIPVVIFFMIVQRQVITGLTAGGVKG